MQQLLERYEVAVWWGTPVEVQSSFERLSRMDQLILDDYVKALQRLEDLHFTWVEVQPTLAVRIQAVAFLAECPLKAGDALQLAAAWIWCLGEPSDCTFISADKQLTRAATQAGFQVVAV